MKIVSPDGKQALEITPEVALSFFNTALHYCKVAGISTFVRFVNVPGSEGVAVLLRDTSMLTDEKGEATIVRKPPALPEEETLEPKKEPA